MKKKIQIDPLILTQMCLSSKEIELFFDVHFDLIQEQSLAPDYSSGQPRFPIYSYLVLKDLTKEDKVKYYAEDFKMFKESKNEE